MIRYTLTLLRHTTSLTRSSLCIPCCGGWVVVQGDEAHLGQGAGGAGLVDPARGLLRQTHSATTTTSATTSTAATNQS